MIVPQMRVGNGVLNGLLKVRCSQSKDKLGKGSASISLTLAIGSFKHSIIGSPHRFSPLMHSTKTNLLEVLEKIDCHGMPFVGIAFIIIIIRNHISGGSGVENHYVHSTHPTMELFADMTELEEALQE